MKYIKRGLIYLLLSSLALNSQDFELQISIGDSDVFSRNGFLADPVTDIHYSSESYGHFTSSHNYAKSSNLIWFEIDDVDFHKSLAQEDLLVSLKLQQDRIHIYSNCRLGISMQIDYQKWQEVLENPEIWDRWLHSLTLYLKSQNIEYLEIYPITKNILESPVKDNIIELQSILEKQEIRTVLGIQEASAALEGSPFLWEIRAFDYSGKHTTLEALEEQLFLLDKKGIPAYSIIAGIPLYGRVYDSGKPGYWFDSMTYDAIIGNFPATADANQLGGYFYNGPDLLIKKINLCLQYQIGGIKLNRIEWDSPEEGLSLYLTALETIP